MFRIVNAEHVDSKSEATVVTINKKHNFGLDDDGLSPLSDEIIAKRIQRILSDEIFEEKAYDSKLEAAERKRIVASYVSRMWSDNLAFLSLALTNSPVSIFLFRESVNDVVLQTGKKLAESYQQFSNITFYNSYGKNESDKPTVYYGNSAPEEKPDSSDMTIYLQINYFSGRKSDRITGNSLSSAANYFLGKQKWNVALYLKANDGSIEDNARRAQWLADNKKMLEELQRKYDKQGRKVSIVDHASLAQEDSYKQALNLFLNVILKDGSVIAAIKKDVLRQLVQDKVYVENTPSKVESNSSIFITHSLQSAHASAHASKEVRTVDDVSEDEGTTLERAASPSSPSAPKKQVRFQVNGKDEKSKDEKSKDKGYGGVSLSRNSLYAAQNSTSASRASSVSNTISRKSLDTFCRVWDKHWEGATESERERLELYRKYLFVCLIANGSVPYTFGKGAPHSCGKEENALVESTMPGRHLRQPS